MNIDKRLILGGVIAFFLLLMLALYLNGDFLPKDEFDQLSWCYTVQPTVNTSMMYINEKHWPRDAIKSYIVQEICFGKYWKDYCKISYPHLCNSNFSYGPKVSYI